MIHKSPPGRWKGYGIGQKSKLLTQQHLEWQRCGCHSRIIACSALPQLQGAVLDNIRINRKRINIYRDICILGSVSLYSIACESSRRGRVNAISKSRSNQFALFENQTGSRDFDRSISGRVGSGGVYEEARETT